MRSIASSILVGKKKREMSSSVLLQLLPFEVAGDSKSGVDLRVYCTEAESEDRQVYSYFQSQCTLETGKARNLMCLLQTRRKENRFT